MPFVKRDAEGAVCALFRERSEEVWEYLEPHHPDVVEFTLSGEMADPFVPPREELTETDFALIRAIEDVVNLLLEKRIFVEADLSEQLLELLERRRKLRALIRNIMA